MAGNGNPMPQMSPAQTNQAARNLVLATSVEMKQQIYSAQIDPASPVVNIPFQNIGLIKYFLVKVQGTIRNTNAGAVGATRTQLGASNLLRQVQLTDYQNTVRINTSGWHLNLVNSAKQPMVFGACIAPNVPENFGVNSAIMTAPSTIAAATDATINYYYVVPCAISANDLTGAIYAGLVNATAQLQLTINATPGANAPVAGTQDPTLAVYQANSGTAGATEIVWKSGTKVTITVWQVYLDQLPFNQGLPILPPSDMNTIYELKNTTLSALVANQDFNIPYANFRTFLSTSVVYDNGGVLANGSDINYWMLQAANAQQIFKFGPDEAYFYARNVFNTDPPLGVYFFDHRARPINTQNFGNMNLVLNASTVNTNAACLVGFEDLAQVQTIVQYGALPNS